MAVSDPQENAEPAASVAAAGPNHDPHRLTVPVKLWDLPVRLFHWALAICVGMAWWTGDRGDIEGHLGWGYAVLGLVLFRILWGFIGGETARFGHFVKGPRAVLAYARKLAGSGYRPTLGHGALGGLAVLALLGALLVQTGTGLFSYDSSGHSFAEGALAVTIDDFDTLDALSQFHGSFVNVLLALIGLHLVAIMFYLGVKRDNILGPMISGRRRWWAGDRAPRLVPLWRAVALAALVTGAVLALRSQFWLHGAAGF